MSIDVTNVTHAESAARNVSGRPGAGAVDPIRSNAVRPSADAAPALQTPKPADLGFDPEETRRNLAEAIDRLNEQMRRNGRDLNFRVDDRVQRTVITVNHAQTGEVVRQIPLEEILKVAHSIEDMKGLLFNSIT